MAEEKKRTITIVVSEDGPTTRLAVDMALDQLYDGVSLMAMAARVDLAQVVEDGLDELLQAVRRRAWGYREYYERVNFLRTRVGTRTKELTAEVGALEAEIRGLGACELRLPGADGIDDANDFDCLKTALHSHHANGHGTRQSDSRQTLPKPSGPVVGRRSFLSTWHDRHSGVLIVADSAITFPIARFSDHRAAQLNDLIDHAPHDR